MRFFGYIYYSQCRLFNTIFSLYFLFAFLIFFYFCIFAFRISHFSIFVFSLLSTLIGKSVDWKLILADFKNNQTTKQFNRKVETKLYLLTIGPKRIDLLFSCLIVYKIRSQTKLVLTILIF